MPITDIIGQPSVRDQLSVALAASRSDRTRFDHSLLVGPPGCGKTMTARIISEEMHTKYLETLGQSLKTHGDLCHLLLSATDRTTIFIDEAHELPESLQTTLYLALDQGRVDFRRKGCGSIPAKVKDFTLLLATTDEYRLLEPLRDRMRIVLRFRQYELQDLDEIIRLNVRREGWRIQRGVETEISNRSRGVPRLALRLLRAAYRVSRSVGEPGISLKSLNRACEMEGIDERGLGPVEQQILHLLRDNGGSLPLNVLASHIGLPARTISEVSEPFLIRSGLMSKESSRRVLTGEGFQHLEGKRLDS